MSDPVVVVAESWDQMLARLQLSEGFLRRLRRDREPRYRKAGDEFVFPRPNLIHINEEDR